ncbi:MAG: cobyrinate a,c-diamide synthase [Magnetovibrionaceae bacterium]
MATPTLMIAAPGSGSGKTTVTLGILRALKRSGMEAGSFKVGPDYIDPGFHQAASGRVCFNLDGWAMRPETLEHLYLRACFEADLVVGEGVMGLFDGSGAGTGSTADLAAALEAPVILVVDAAAQAGSAAALVHGFATWRADVRVAGVIFNRVGSDAHETLLREACEPLDLPVLGCLRRDPGLVLAERHLGLVQAREHGDLEGFIDRAADAIEKAIDLDALKALAISPPIGTEERLPAYVPGQRIAIAHDAAFTFTYPHLLRDWRAAGAEVYPFSPLNNERPDFSVDACYLPGGYPELYAGQLAAAETFKEGMQSLAGGGRQVIGECGGYMVLGRGLVDREGTRHEMCGVLDLECSFEERKLHLGYREVRLLIDCPLGKAGLRMRGHEFHYATIQSEKTDKPVFSVKDAKGKSMGRMGQRRRNVIGSFIHIIDHI